MRTHRLAILASLLAAISLVGCGDPSAVSIEQYLASGRYSAAAAPARGQTAAAAPARISLALLPDMHEPIGDGPPAGDAAEKDPPAGPKPEGWSTRRGPAYPNDWLHTLGRDAKELVPSLWDDTKAAGTDPLTLAAFGLAGAAGIILNASGSDNKVAEHYERNGSQLNGFFDGVGDVGGNPGTHFAIAGAMYFASQATGDVKTYETSKAMINALALNGLTTLALKGITRTRSPNGDPFGWPSGHTSSTFTFATVMHEAYGPWVGVPLYVFASYVGYERIDARNHDFSDVISGAIMGVAIGHVVMRNHKPRVFGFEVIPWADPARSAVGVALTRSW